jgi:dihydrofolate reductase/thymidylate synthase
MQRPFSVIVASTPRGGIGKDGALPWKLPEDMAHFKRVTLAKAGDGMRNAVIMGSRTWASIPEKFRPLEGRLNVVLTRKAEDPAFCSPYPDGVLVASSVSAALELLGATSDVAEIFVIGGEQAYKEAVAIASCERIFVTRIAKDMDCDAFFPAFDETHYKLVHVSKTRSRDGLPYDFVVYERSEEGLEQRIKRMRLASPTKAGLHAAPLSAALAAATGGSPQFLHDEYNYLSAIREIIEKGVPTGDRTGVGTRAIFGMQVRFDLGTTFPLLTTKRVFWRGVLEELLWFIRGDTNAKHLSEKGVKIWDANGSREFLDKRGLSHREEGDLGPVYGFQWRHFGAKYVDMHTNYEGQGVDQLAECIKKIKEDPTDRRILLSAWNPADLGLMALPPCHMFCQFYVANGALSCLMYQRSCDMGLGVPFNIASYSLLTCMIAQVCGLKPGEFIHSMGNAHVYENHIEALKTQLERTPRPFPVLRINPDVKDIDSFEAKDFEILGYNPHGKIAMEMAV